MYHLPPAYPYPYHTHTQMYSSNFRSNADPVMNQQAMISQAILARMKGEASAIDLYSRLVQIAPEQQQKQNILQVLEDEKIHLQQLTDQYIRLTGRHPFYEIENIPFQTYQEGLQRAFELKWKDYEEYRNHYLFTKPSAVRELFLRTLNDEAKHVQQLDELRLSRNDHGIELRDYGPDPFVININEATKQNTAYRMALWTGHHLQITLMSLNVGEDIGLEIHPHLDQFLRIEQGQGIIQMGKQENQLNFKEEVYDDFVIVIPAGTWHNLTNTGDIPLKLYSIYAPPQHPFGTVHRTKADAMEAEPEHHHNP